MLGYAGKILYIDLKDKLVEPRETSEKLARSFLGGRGLGSALLYQEIGPAAEPLSPENVLIFMTGPATGTPVPACPRWTAVTKSPLTGMYMCSSAGGFFGAELKFAGFDGLVIRGRAEKPTWLQITDGTAELLDASWLWGLDTEKTEIEIQKELKDRRTRVASIGPAGENLVRFASIQVDMCSTGRCGSFGRCGGGAVMGSKKLKAISVRGHYKFEVFDEEGLSLFVRQLISEMKDNESINKFSKWGSSQFVGPVNEARMWPTRNFQQGYFEGSEGINAETLRKSLVIKDTACFACVIASGKLSMVTEGKYAGTIVDGPEYETIWSFGPQCGVDSLEAIAAANMWCDRYGLDTISTGNLIGFAMECHERGLLENDDGLGLHFGNDAAILELIRKIAYRKGLGDLLADGVSAAAKKIGRGSEHFAMHVKGLELPAYDPRGAWGMALSYATASRGGCHLKGWTLSAEVFAPKFDRFSMEGKARLVFDLQNTRAVVDSMGVCVFGSRAIGVEDMVKILSLTAGVNLSANELIGIGERVYNLERMLAIRDGISRRDDTLPPRIFDEKLHGIDGPKLERRHFEQMLDEYYEIRGWSMDGKPRREKLEELGLIDFL